MRRKLSDTVTVDSEGRVTVDVNKLFAKPHIVAMLKAIRAKIRYVRRNP